METANRYICTFGYGNRTNYDEILRYIKDLNIAYVIDVRRVTRAWSRIWYGDKLSAFCNSSNIKYISKTSLGNTSGNKKWVPENPESANKELVEVAEIIKESNVLLLCAEKDSKRCHRSEVANCLSSLTSIPIKHLE